MALDIQLSMFIQSLSELFSVYHKEQMFVKTSVYLFESRAILFSLPRKKLTGYEYRSAFLLFYCSLLCLNFLPLLTSFPLLPGARIISCPKQDILMVRSEPVDKFQAVYIRIVQAQRERIDKKSDLTLLSEQDGVRKHTEMDESGQRLALRPVFVNICDLLNQRILFVEIYSCTDFLSIVLHNFRPLSAVWQYKQISQNSEKVQMNLKK